MQVFGMAALFGLMLGFLFGVGCASAVMYAIYMGGYRKAVEYSQESVYTTRFQQAMEKLSARRARAQASLKYWRGR